jgi:hypothetical protein
MHAAWDEAHTDYGPSRSLQPCPRGLAAGQEDWRARLEDAPNGWLLRAGSLLETLTSGRPVYLMHTTSYLGEIRASRQLYQAAGCLVGALYGALLTREAAGLRPRNLGAWLLETKPDTSTIVFEIEPLHAIPAKGINYLSLGTIHLATYYDHASFLTPAEDEGLRRAAVERIRHTAPFLDQLLAAACGTHIPPRRLLDALAAAVPTLPFLGYLYFEVVAEYLMLYSTSPATKACAQAGELNNRLYKQLAFSAVDTMGDLFDLALFRPGHDQLLELIADIEPGLAARVVSYIGERLPHVLARAALAADHDASAVSFRNATYADLAWTAPGLLGQMLFRLMRASPRYPQLFPVFEQAKATAVSSYWNTEQIPVPFNGVIPKGEIGLNLAWPQGARTWIAEACPRGLLHPVQELDLTFVPRLADLRETALGRARFPISKPTERPAASAFDL